MALLRNPNVARIPMGLWVFWAEFQAMEPTVLLGGVYAPKTGYHNTRAANPRNDYSVVRAVDRRGPGDKAAAVDITFPEAQRGDYSRIGKYSRRLMRSGKDMADERGNYLREFYGQTDKDRHVEGWDFQLLTEITSDVSHLWHIHLSWCRAYVDDPKATRAVLSILRGETVQQWRRAEAARLLPPKPKPKPKPKPPTPPVIVVPPTPPVVIVPPTPETPPIVVLPPTPETPPVVIVPPTPDTPPVVVVPPSTPELPGTESPADPPVVEPAPETPPGGWAAFFAWLARAFRFTTK